VVRIRDFPLGEVSVKVGETEFGLNRVEDHLKERVIEDWCRFDQNVIDRALHESTV